MIGVMINTPDIECSECGENISLTVAKIAEDGDCASVLDGFRYLCPICAIQHKNMAMHAQMRRTMG